MKEKKNMANIMKQAIATLPVKQNMKLRFSYKDDWYTMVKRIWGKKEITRYTFNLYNSDNGKRFECGSELAKDIINEVDSSVDEDNINVYKTEGVNINLIKNKDGFEILVNPKEELSKWGKVKKFFSFKREKIDE
jgi:hypothetical protein